MKLTKDQVRQVAKLARIKLTEAELEKFQTQLSSILDYIEQLNEINTDDIEPTAQITGLINVTREDTTNRDLAKTEELLKCSPLPIERNQIKVKSVFQ